MKKNNGRTTHGMSGTPTYISWSNMVARCNKPKATGYRYYGGRGITVCDRWLQFECFLADMGECPEGYSIERENVDGNYGPENCIWLPRSEQAVNRRNAVTHQGKRPKELAQQYGLILTTARYRIDNGIPIDKPVGIEKFITYDGMTMNRSAWAKKIGVSRSTITHRLKMGRPLSEVLYELSPTC